MHEVKFFFFKRLQPSHTPPPPNHMKNQHKILPACVFNNSITKLLYLEIQVEAHVPLEHSVFLWTHIKIRTWQTLTVFPAVLKYITDASQGRGAQR